MEYRFSPNNRALSLSWIWCPLAPCKKSKKSNTPDQCYGWTNTWTDRCTRVHRNSLKRVNILSVLNTAVYLKLIVKLTAASLMFSSFYYRLIKNKLKEKPFMTPFYEWGSIFTAKFPEIPGAHFIDLGKLKGWVDLGATQ